MVVFRWAPHPVVASLATADLLLLAFVASGASAARISRELRLRGARALIVVLALGIAATQTRGVWLAALVFVLLLLVISMSEPTFYAGSLATFLFFLYAGLSLAKREPPVVAEPHPPVTCGMLRVY